MLPNAKVGQEGLPPEQRDPLMSNPLLALALLVVLLGLGFRYLWPDSISAEDLFWTFWRVTGRYWIMLSGALWLFAVIVVIARVKARHQRKGSLRKVEMILSRDDYADPHQVAHMLTAIYHQLRVRPPLFGIFQGDWTRIFFGTDHCTWEMTKGADGITRFWLVAPASQLRAIMGRIQGVYENVRFGPVEPVGNVPALRHTFQMDLLRRNHYLYTTKTQKDYAMSIVEALAAAWAKEPGEVMLQYVLKPLPLTAYKRLKKHQLEFQERYLAMQNSDPTHPGIGYVQDKELKASLESIGHGLFTVEIRLQASSLDLIRATVGGLGEAAGANAFVERRIWVMRRQWREWLNSRMTTLFAPFPKIILSSAHLATILHLPTVRLRGVSFNRVELRRAAASDRIERDPGRAVVTDEVGPVSIPEDSRKYGMLILGVQGQGKSTLMLMMIRGDIQARSKAIFVVDPKSDLARDALALVPTDMPLWYLDFSNPRNDLSIPLFRYASSADVIADNVISALQSAFGADSIGPRSDSLIRNAIYAVYEVYGPQATLWEIYRMLADDAFREDVTRKVRTQFQRGFWRKQAEVADESPKFWEEITAAPRNKLERILAVDALRTAFVSGKRALDLQAVIERRGMLIVNLAKGVIGESNAAFAGSLILATIWQAIQAQAARTHSDRLPVAVHVDEAHNLANRSTAVMLAEGRGLGLQPVFAHQHRDQISDDDAKAAFESLLQNRAIFRTEALSDAEYFAKVGARVHSQTLGVTPEIQSRLTLGADDLMQMPRYHMAMRLIVNGEPQPLFVAKTIDHTRYLNPMLQEENLKRTAPQAAPPVPADSSSLTAGEDDPEDSLEASSQEAPIDQPDSADPAATPVQEVAPDTAPARSPSKQATLDPWNGLATMYGLNEFGGGAALRELAREVGATYADVQVALQDLALRRRHAGDAWTALRKTLQKTHR